MRIWCIQIGEPLPIDHQKGRLWRIGLLSKTLIGRGHQVTWWTSTFFHSHKVHRYDKDTFLDYEDHYRIILLYGRSYTKNISIRRILNHRTIAGKFLSYARNEAKPDIILCGLPTLEFCAAATKYGNENNIPVVIDIRDMWPDIMLDIFPVWAKPIGRLLLNPLFQSVKKSCRLATAISGMSHAFVQKGLSHAERDKTKLDQDFPFGYPEEPIDDFSFHQALEFWKKYGVNQHDNRFIVCFFGILGKRIELQTLIQAAREVQTSGRSFLFVICGKGSMSERCKKWALGGTNIIFPGWIGYSEIKTLMKVASVGVLPYPSTQDFSASIPNKVIEYFSGGLPVLSSVQGVLQELLSVYKCGVTYENKNIRQLSEILNYLYDNPERLSELSQNATKLFEQKYTAQSVYTMMSAHLENIIVKYKDSN
jgi:glycosyltransferase involved in cell wall biosynthesis